MSNGVLTKNIKEPLALCLKDWSIVGEGGAFSQRLAAFTGTSRDRASQMKWVDLALFKRNGPRRTILIEVEEGNHLNSRTILADILLLQWCDSLPIDFGNEEIELLGSESQPMILVIGTVSSKTNDPAQKMSKFIESIGRISNDFFRIPAWIAYRESLSTLQKQNGENASLLIEEVVGLVANFSAWADTSMGTRPGYPGWVFEQAIAQK